MILCLRSTIACFLASAIVMEVSWEEFETKLARNISLVPCFAIPGQDERDYMIPSIRQYALGPKLKMVDLV